ncbi:CBS domain-containing protein [Flavimaricola marinus]|uniref:Inosine 5'-monophosphate dehydrogenase n=1 Tax=Flavimaricola marinus TaxID=1819565 RepID=A0A238LG34_9RHOB|nr:CBS domain-containing protein [Flavimaricola marinus]SMY07926.1 inosine 5'-monophosphate dehydrogenase [Flavimaricola marinus]
MTISKVLKSKGEMDVITVSPGASLAEVAEILSANKIGAVVVSPDGKAVAGILSERDIVREIGKRGPSCLTDPVTEVMTSKVTTCTAQDSAIEIMQMMTSGRFRHMPVMEGDDMVGFISIGDVVKMRLAELSMEKEALEGMIMGH